MIRVQPEKFRDILVDEAMESHYHQFGPADNSSVRGEYKVTPQSGMKRIVPFVLYGILVLLLLILLMVTGIKFSQLNKEVTDVKFNLERISNGRKTSSSGSEGRAVVQEVPLQQREPIRGTCREGWMSFQRSCYLLSKAALTWNQAETQCQSQGGHLLVLNSVEELDYISEIADYRPSYWIGLVERENEGHWSWVDGTDFSSTPTFWDEGQPDNWDYRVNGEDCGQLHGSTRRKRKMWNDADCNMQYRYICEARV
ncbi:C-type lectin domain family 4 member E-like isoform X1 [Lates japonicus]